MAFETYQRWYSDLTTQRQALCATIEKLSQDSNHSWFLLQKELDRLTDMKAVYVSANTSIKQQLVRVVFDNQLYYKDGIYRTGYLMPVFAHNSLILKQKNLLVIEEKRRLSAESPLRWS